MVTVVDTKGGPKWWEGGMKVCGHCYNQCQPYWLDFCVCSYHIFPSRSQGVALFKAASSPLGLQLPVLFKTFGLHLCSTSHGDQSGMHLHLAVCPCGGHLVLHLASTICGFGTSILPISTARASWGQPSMAGECSCHAPPASSKSSATCSATLCHLGLCVAFEGDSLVIVYIQ